MTTGGSAATRLFPAWARLLDLGDVRLDGVDLPLHADRRTYREVVGRIKDDDDARGALVTTHKVDLFEACRDLFDAVIISADAGYRKPNPLIFERIMEMMRLKPHEILFVGDTPHDDVMGAKQMGMHAAWIRRRERLLPDGVPAPDLVIGDLAELPDHIGC